MTGYGEERRQCRVAIESGGSPPDRYRFEHAGMSGVELISHIRSTYPSIPVVAMSGDYQGDAIPAAIIADGFYPKGEHPHDLLSAIASLLASNPLAEAGKKAALRRP